MADGTHKLTKYDMTFVFWMVIDCLLKSKFVGYTANFTENLDVIIDGAHVFFHTHYGRKPSNHYSCLTTRILHIILLLIWILPALPTLITTLKMIPWTILFDAIIQKILTRLVILVFFRDQQHSMLFDYFDPCY
jgi:hypothetical protein